MDHLVLFFRDQRLSVEQRLAFGRRFGKLRLRCAPSPISVTVPTDRGEKRPRRKKLSGMSPDRGRGPGTRAAGCRTGTSGGDDGSRP